MNVIDKARMLRRKIEDNAKVLDDSDAVAYVDLFPMWSGLGVDYEVGDRVRYEGILFKVLQSHKSQETWTPTDAPSLFAEVLIPDPGTVPVWKQPDSTNPYMTGDRVHYPDENGPIYRSTIDNNVWSPETYPAGWSME